MFESLTLSDISKKQCGVLRKPTSTSPVIWRIEENGVRAIVKDFRFNGFLFRNTVGRFLIWREAKAYRRLKGLKGIPTLYRSIDGIALVIEEIRGRDIEPLEIISRLSEDFYKDLRLLIEKIHNRGIAHCDLKRAPNIILGNDGKPYIVDWAASISRHEFRFFPLRYIYERFIQDDLNTITKLKLKYCPERVTPKEKSKYTKRSKAEIIIRTIKDKIKDNLKRIL
jgi:RIO-like serine/threonine protein kinase